MFLPLLIAGLILVLAGGSWFTGAVTVGTICLVIAAVLFVIQIAAFAAVAKVGASTNRRIRRGF